MNIFENITMAAELGWQSVGLLFGIVWALHNWTDKNKGTSPLWLHRTYGWLGALLLPLVLLTTVGRLLKGEYLTAVLPMLITHSSFIAFKARNVGKNVKTYGVEVDLVEGAE